MPDMISMLVIEQF